MLTRLGSGVKVRVTSQGEVAVAAMVSGKMPAVVDTALPITTGGSSVLMKLQGGRLKVRVMDARPAVATVKANVEMATCSTHSTARAYSFGTGVKGTEAVSVRGQ